MLCRFCSGGCFCCFFFQTLFSQFLVSVGEREFKEKREMTKEKANHRLSAHTQAVAYLVGATVADKMVEEYTTVAK